MMLSAGNNGDEGSAPREPSMPSNPERVSLEEFGWKFLNAMARIGALAVVGTVHYFLEKSLDYVVPDVLLPAGKTWLQIVSYVVFSLIYVYLLWETLKVFVPALQAKKYPGQVLQAKQYPDLVEGNDDNTKG
jgi:hypothetical protein